MSNEQKHHQSRMGPRRGPHHGPGMPVQKAKDFKGTLRRLVGYLKPYKWSLFSVLIATILSTVFTIASPKIMGKATTKLFEGLMAKLSGTPGAGIDFPYILNIVLLLAGLYLVSSLFSYIQQFIMASIAQKTVYDIREEVNHKLTRLPLKFFDSKSHGDVLSRVVNDMENVSNTLQQSLTMMIQSVVTVLGIIVMMLTISPLMTLIVICTIPLSLFILQPITKRSQRFFMAQQKNLGLLNGHVEEMFTGHEVVKAYGHEKQSVEKFNHINEDLYRAGWKAQFISGVIMPIMTFVNNIGYVFVCIIGGILVTHGAIQIGDIQAFIQYARQFSQPINQVANIANIIQATIASAERVFEVLDEQEEVLDGASAMTLSSPKGDVRFEQVSFRYKEDEPLIEDLNLDVKSGQSIAIVGPTGAGKTTLVNLLMRFYEIQKGKITIDGVDITHIKRGELRSLFGMVLQDTWLFKGTIKENIAYGRDRVSDKEIFEAAKAARADHFIRTLPDGYETILNEEASNISQGQKQLLTIARAILAQPTILILDEATSSVDTRTEIHIQEAMDHLLKGKTSFIIAHRLSTIQNADVILVMKNGTVIEQGNHKDLLNKEGFYAELYYSQFHQGNTTQQSS
ncbi:ATP-binding cassette subfamily B protein [Pullulanibacillus pueri]|uniref:ABC transporter n=1 Tax=Pullulanibacillus pueri TaxID=1437324 RepID=A0A8J2ZVY7_9BACL|nr:ABC transporter ATP-binding protein [Pullulanibacillus pueri]MBM7682349.1 ATP-binding cassette subfamily B protein [Pullulanibacillus pueri]GGH80702.1 ABC transporter [Pullulanibacillus pueri]